MEIRNMIGTITFKKKNDRSLYFDLKGKRKDRNKTGTKLKKMKNKRIDMWDFYKRGDTIMFRDKYHEENGIVKTFLIGEDWVNDYKQMSDNNLMYYNKKWDWIHVGNVDNIRSVRMVLVEKVLKDKRWDDFEERDRSPFSL